MSDASLEETRDDTGRRVVWLRGSLDGDAVADLWNRAKKAAAGDDPLIVDASGVRTCDVRGAVLLAELEHRFAGGGPRPLLRGLHPDHQVLLELVAHQGRTAVAEPAPGLVARLGRAALTLFASTRANIAFLGELAGACGYALTHPMRVRWSDVIRISEQAGIQAVPIVALIGFLLGLILAFQSATSLQRFGAEIFVADMLGLAMFRELAPLMTSVMLTARSGSAFAAEIGTMKVNEEVDALTTMGLEPMGFLVVPRVFAAVIVTPSLTMLMNFFGLLGGLLVMLSLGFPMQTYLSRIDYMTEVIDMTGGLAKAMVFGVLIAAVGCMRGLRTGNSAGAVGRSTTSSVVSGIVLVAVADGLFAILYYLLDI